MAFPTKSGNQDFVIFLNVVQTTIIGNKSSDLLSVLDQLNTSTLSNSRVGLFSLNTTLLKNNPLGVGRSSKWLLPFITKMRFLVSLISPSLPSTVGLQFATSSHSTCFPHGDGTRWLCCSWRFRVPVLLRELLS
nr:Predicted gene, EG381438 [Ipomoea batatas]